SDRRRGRRWRRRGDGATALLVSVALKPDKERAGHPRALFSPAFLPRPEIHLERPGAALLAMELPIGLGDVVGIEDTVRSRIVAFREIALDPLCVDRAVDHDMGDMDVLRPELARHRLRQ